MKPLETRSSNEVYPDYNSSTADFVSNILPFYKISKGRTNLPESVLIIIYPNSYSFPFIMATLTNF